MIRALAILLAVATPLAAEPARVLTGEHGDFTRLVIELPDEEGWTVGRTPLGYAFAAEGETQPDYDLSGVWQRIARTRLQSVQVDPKTGALYLTLACDCHVFPFEYRPGVIVLDIKPGAPPPASVFEADFAPIEDKATTPEVGSEGGGYVWLRDIQKPKAKKASASLPLPLATGSISLDPLREELLKEISRGAADGIVDMELPGRPSEVAAADHGDLPWSQIRIGEQPGVAVTDPFDTAGTSMSECVSNEIVDLAALAGTRPAYDLLAEARSGLYGEFDAADTKAVLRSIRLYLYLGFGAEARQHADMIDDPSVTDELAYYRSMARILDGESDPQTPFAAMLDCDGPAALWAALAHDRLPAGRSLNRDAILQSFVALPSHLRLHFGSGLAEKFLAMGDAEAARLIRDAVERTPDADMAAVALLDASADMHQGDVEAAQAHAEHAVSLDGNDASALVALVEAHFRKLDPIDTQISEALIALQGETRGTAEGAAVDRALVLALALSGQTDSAFVADGAKAEVLADLWRVTLDRATDDEFLRHAVLSGGADRPETSPDVALGVAARLLALGFPDAALAWLGPVADTDPAERRRLAATAAFKSGDGRTAVQLLDGLHDPELEDLRASALIQLGDLSGAGEALAAAGNGDEAARVGRWDGDWTGLEAATPEPWLKAADHVAPANQEGDLGLLAKGGRSVEDGLAAREAIEALLSSVPSPAGG
jgi:tetratricopeptide (TPR) repeat protein